MPVPDRFESLFISGEGECTRLSQVGWCRGKAFDILLDMCAELRGQAVSVAVDAMAGGAEALAVEDHSAWPGICRSVGRLGLGW